VSIASDRQSFHKIRNTTTGGGKSSDEEILGRIDSQQIGPISRHAKKLLRREENCKEKTGSFMRTMDPLRAGGEGPGGLKRSQHTRKK